jgi:lipopolysaccharide export system protein LptA
MRLKSLTLSAALTAVLLAHPAAAQLATNTSAPVDITADELETANNACTSIWRGHAEALQDNARLRADVLTADFEVKPGGKGAGAPAGGGGGCGDLVRLKADGSVYYVTPTQKVHGDNAVYEAATTVLTITGDVVATQGQNVLRGTRMVFNTQTGQGHMEGAAKGRNQADRPRGVFYPKQSGSSGGAKSSTASKANASKSSKTASGAGR